MDFVEYLMGATTTGILTEAGKPTALVQRSRLIVALTEAVGQPPRLMGIITHTKAVG